MDDLDKIRKALKKLGKTDRKLEACKKQCGNLRHKQLAAIANDLGMERSKSRNTEPYFESTLIDAPPIPIPDHSKTFGKGIAVQIIKQLQNQAFLLREFLIDEEAKHTGERHQLTDWYDD